jgi:predicted transcriptional regulator
MKNTQYINIQGWMVNELKLKSNELLIFAIIFGFSQDNESEFNGSIKYLQNCLGLSKNTVITVLKSLTRKGFILKNENLLKGVKFCTYTQNEPLVQKMVWGGAKTEPGGGAKIAPNNTIINNTNNINSAEVKTSTPKIDFTKLLDFINVQTKRTGKDKFRLINKTIQSKYKSRLKDGYTNEDIANAIKNAVLDKYHKDTNYKYLTPEFFSRANIIDKHAFKSKNKKKDIDKWEKVSYKDD